MLAEYLSRVWPLDRDLPQYWAIDLPEMLPQLSLPPRVHNNSKKFTTEEFYKSKLRENAEFIKLIIIRNTLHEMDIVDTSQLIDAIRFFLPVEALVYIQDMARLPKPERRNVPWTRELLETALRDIGFDICGAFDLTSHSGTPWFTLLIRNPSQTTTMASGPVLAKARSTQSSNLLGELRAISKGYENVDKLILLQHEFSCLEVQLINAEFTQITKVHDESFERIGVPIRAPSQNEYAFATSDTISQKTGLLGLIASKRLLDFPTLISSAQKQIAFGGYSNRPLFRSSANITSLESAITGGAIVRVMIVSPDSIVARLRSEEPIYANPSKFLTDIRETIDHGRRFFQKLSETLGKEVASDRFKLRASNRVPRWSYFIVDDTCYLSFYSSTLTGSLGPCFIFRARLTLTNNYFHLVQKEFSDVFEESTDLLDGE